MSNKFCSGTGDGMSHYAVSPKPGWFLIFNLLTWQNEFSECIPVFLFASVALWATTLFSPRTPQHLVQLGNGTWQCIVLQPLPHVGLQTGTPYFAEPRMGLQRCDRWMWVDPSMALVSQHHQTKNIFSVWHVQQKHMMPFQGICFGHAGSCHQ